MTINLQMQHTPKPEAQVPSFVPPFVEHSSLEFYKKFTSKDYICQILFSISNFIFVIFELKFSFSADISCFYVMIYNSKT